MRLFCVCMQRKTAKTRQQQFASFLQTKQRIITQKQTNLKAFLSLLVAVLPLLFSCLKTINFAQSKDNENIKHTLLNVMIFSAFLQYLNCFIFRLLRYKHKTSQKTNKTILYVNCFIKLLVFNHLAFGFNQNVKCRLTEWQIIFTTLQT